MAEYKKEEFVKLSTEEERIAYLVSHRPDLNPPKRCYSKPTNYRRWL